MRRKNTSTDSLKERIADALIHLMEAKPWGKITIQEITCLAEVGRVTYFRNFTSKEDVITYKILRLWDRFSQSHHLTEKSKYTLDTAEAFFIFSLGMRQLHGLIYAAGIQSVLYNAFYQVMVPPAVTDPAALYRNRFLSYGLFGMLDEWIRRDYQESPQEMARIIHEKILPAVRT